MRQKLLIVFGGLCFSFLIISLAWSHLLNFIYQQLILTPSSVAYKMWDNLPVPIYFELFVFDWENAVEYEANPSGVRPKFKEIGPFVYEETRGRIDVFWSDGGSKITYNQTRTWKFIPEKSADITVNVTNLNALALTVASLSKSWDSKFLRLFANAIINRYESLFVTASAETWLFDGITHQLLEILINPMRNFTYIPIPYEKFAWFYGRNGSPVFDGRFEIFTGNTDLYDLGHLVSWNNMRKSQYYEGKCGEIKGIAGEIMPPIKQYQKSLTLFAPDLCSYMKLNQVENATNGEFGGNVYESDNSVFDNGDLYPDNRCFCGNLCPPSGARDVSLCKMGTPAVVSFPHFYEADPIYTNKIDGMSPERKQHSFMIELDPRTGIPYQVQAGIQINFQLYPYEWCDIYQDKPEIYVPMLWFRQKAKISNSMFYILKVLHFAVDHGSIVFFCFAEICFIIIGAIMLTPKYRESIKIASSKVHSSWPQNKYTPKIKNKK